MIFIYKDKIRSTIYTDMVQTRIEEGAKYRRLKREQMGDEAYRASEARKRRERRHRMAAPVQQQPEPDTTLDDIYTAKLILAESKGHTIKRSSVETAYNRLKRLHKLLHDTDMTDFKWVKDTTNVRDFIMKSDKWGSVESRIQQFQSLSSILKVVKGYETQYNFYSRKSIEMRNDKTKVDDKNEMTEKEKANMLSWPKIKQIKPTTSHDKALVGVYVDMPPRRLDYRIMKLTTTPDDLDELTSTFNYLVLNNRGTPKSFVFLNYKTASKFGRQEFTIPRGLAVKLKAYISETGLTSGHFLFGKTKDKPYVSFSTHVTKVFKKYTDKNLSVNLLRHSYISWFLKKKGLTIENKKEVSTKMAHSLHMQEKYNRVK